MNNEKIKEKTQSVVVSPKNMEVIPQQGSAEILIAQAIQKGLPVETMERLLAMRRELKAEWAKEQFNKAMAAFQGECPIIEKVKKVDFTSKRTGQRTNYSYAPLDVIVKQAGPYIAKNGFSYTITTKVFPEKIEAVVHVNHIDGHSQESGFEINIDKEAYMNTAQKSGSAMTYAKRYAFCNAFGILTGDEDDDGINSGDVKTPPKFTPKTSPVNTRPLPPNNLMIKQQIKNRIDVLYPQIKKTATEYKEIALKTTQLELIEKNYKEINDRLAVIINQRKDKK